LILLPAFPLGGQQIGSAPVITLTSPSSIDSLNNSGIASVRAEIVSISALKTFRIFNNEILVVGENQIKPEKKDNFTYIIESLVPLKRGINVIHVEARNSIGSGSSETRSITCQPEPYIVWLLPASVNSSTESEMVTIKAEVKTDFALKNISINLNGTVLTQEKDGIITLENNRYSLERRIKLIPGKNSIYIAASNIRAVANSTTRIINYSLYSPPVITLTSPSVMDSLNNSGLALVQAKITSKFALQAVRIFNNGTLVVDESSIKPEQKDSITYTMESFVPLKRGINTIFVEAKNSIGFANSENRSVFCQPEPFVKWLLPASVNSTSKSDQLTIKAEIKTDFDLKDISINLNGTVLAQGKEGITPLKNNTYTFERKIQLTHGKNSVIITVNSIKGVANSTTRVINYTLGSAPDITLTSPSVIDSLNNSGLALVKAKITSKFAVQAVRIYNNGIIAVDESGLKPEQKDSITYVIESLVPLKRGTNSIFVEARNSIGSASSETRSINCQPEPFVTWVLPASVISTSESGMLAIKAEIKTDFDLKNININLNGTELAGEKGEISRLNDNTYSFEKTIRLNSDKNTIYLSANNIKGVANSTTRFVGYSQGSAPVITLVSPSAIDSLNNSGIILISAEVVSNVELQTVRIFRNRTIVVNETAKNLEQKDSSTYIFKSLVPLQAGINTILVEAKNNIGIASSEKRSIKCQLEPIVRWILPTTVNSTMESEMLNIKAEIKTNLDVINTSINLNGSVLVRGNEVPTRLNNDTYVFEGTVPLRAGPNSIVFTAVNAKGTGYSNKLSVNYVPGKISEIKWTVPSDINSETDKPEFPVSATLKTKSLIKSTRLSLNGTELVPGDRSKISQKNSQEYLFESILTLKPGVNTIDLSAITEDGTINSEKRVITYLAPSLPVLAWKNPISDQSVVNHSSMEIKMNVKSTVKLENIAVYLNGEFLENINLLSNLKKEDEDFVLGSTVVLKPGDNKIFIKAGNVAGTSTSETRNIKYLVPSVPEITWGNPGTSVSTLSTATINIQANITSTTGLQNLKVFNNEKLLADIPDVNTLLKQQGEYHIDKTITLNQGENRIYLIAENSAGKSTSETRSVNYMAPAAPAVLWVSPSKPQMDINLNSAKIKATIKSSDKLQSLLVYLNGAATEEVDQLSPADSKGEYKFEKEIKLQPGENRIYLIATNISGTTNSEIRSLTNPPANPPVISWTNPSDPNAIVNFEIINIEACIKSATELKSVKILVNGEQQSSEMMFQPPQASDCNYSLSRPVILKEGDNSVYIIAENFAGSAPSEKRLIRFQTGVVEKRLALVIGNSDYGNSNVLKNPVNDANLMEGTLKSMGFNVVKLTNATKNEMMEALREFSKKLPEYNVALFYYAGHGVQVDGQNYLIPTDAAMKEPTDCKWEAVSQNTILEEFERVPENINIVILDACRNNPFRSWSRGGAQGFRAVNAVTGSIISYATSENSTAADGDGSNGTFTEELVKQINIPQSITSVFMNTRKQVMKRTNNAQRPQESNMLTGEFYFKK
jgi:hypothetical protein